MKPIKVKVDQSKSRNRYDMKDLIADACDTFDTDYWEDIKKGNYDVDDMIHEIADSAVPIYYYDIGQFASHNSYLMTEKAELNPEGTPHDQIQSNIYSEIVDGLHAHIAKKESEKL
jgi:hypothetical protein